MLGIERKCKWMKWMKKECLLRAIFALIRLCKKMENCQNNIQIGHIIQTQLKTDQRSASWLAREIGCSRNHVYKIFNKSSLDADLILKISVATSFNFFQHYTAAFLDNMKARIGEE